MVELSLLSGTLRVSVDGAQGIAYSEANPLPGGGIRLWSAQNSGVKFDDFYICQPKVEADPSSQVTPPNGPIKL